MTQYRTSSATVDPRSRAPIAVRLARSAASGRQPAALAAFHRWFAARRMATYVDTTRVPLDDLAGWEREPGTGNLRHASGRFFTVEGLEVRIPGAPVAGWSQPIINQPEVGILGILVREFDGVLHFLMQAKVEPGNHDGPQLSPTVQATRSNYTRVHQGRTVPYLDYFQDTAGRHVIADVRQSEQGSAFHRKRNRNIVVEVTEEVELEEGFRWLTLGQIHEFLGLDDMINMDARTVLACLPFAGTGLTDAITSEDPFQAALLRSCSGSGGGLHTVEDILSWVTDARCRTDLTTRRVPLQGLPGWEYRDGQLSHESGRFFDVLGLDVRASGREVSRWMQPMMKPYGTGIVAFLVASFDGVLHVLVHTRVEAGYLDVVELAPTVQCSPENYELLPPAARPRFLDEVLDLPRERIRYETLLSEEGGRFHHARNRYLVAEVEPLRRYEGPDHRWVTLHHLVGLLRHSHYLNVQARSLIACLHSLSGRQQRPVGVRVEPRR
jgi:dTDP-4-dehydro-6-deoxy-alpha-D-glucopyranose 2,3-dehydratase